MPKPASAPAPIPLSWYLQPDTPELARALLGAVLVAVDPISGQRSAGRIAETEAYCGTGDRACHAAEGRRTPRTEIMYQAGGLAYVYRCYGIHHLFNVVTHAEGEPHAVLIRALEPLEGVEHMMARRGLAALHPRLSAGPGCLTQAMGITTADNGALLSGPRIWIEPGEPPSARAIASGSRIGIEGAGPEAVSKPWRFWIKDSVWVSR